MNYTIRVACYERVSTEEQSKHGLSIDAQIAALGRWVSDQHHILVGHYTDSGVSGGKPIDKRPAMWRLLQDVQAGLVDLVIFTKLDRWFRSLKNYYKAQEILDGSHCAWQAIDEDYETLTASGRFKVNIMLSVAENERERTSERIKAVMQYKRARGEYLTGDHGAIWGYHVVDKKLVKNPDVAPACDRFWSLVKTGMPYKTAARQVSLEYNIRRSDSAWCTVYHSTIYKGLHDGNTAYCEPYISAAEWDRIHSHKALKRPRSDRVYLFTGLLICPDCGRRMFARATVSRNKTYIYYRCNEQLLESCETRFRMTEKAVEQKLIDQLFPDGRIVIDALTQKHQEEAPQVSVQSLQAKMRRLAQTYTDGLISDETYHNQLEEIRAAIDALSKAPQRPLRPSMDAVRDFLHGDIKTVYEKLTRIEKQRFWRTILLRIDVQKDGSLLPVFLT